MNLNLSSLLDKLRIAGPDLIVGIMGVPIAFTFQTIASKVDSGDLYLSKLRLYLFLGLLILYYLIFALTMLDLTHSFDELSVRSRIVQALLALVATGLIFALGYEGRCDQQLKDWLYASIIVVGLMLLPRMWRSDLATKEPILGLLLVVLVFCSTLFGMIT